jgi:hypothetical protein
MERNIFIHARKVLLHAVNLRHGTDGFTSLFEGSGAPDFYHIDLGRDRTRETWVQWQAR